MSVEAIYMGKRKNGEYWVNVRNANPKGLIGDAGVVRRFGNEKQAKEYVASVNKTGVDTFIVEKEQKPMPIRHEGDVFVKTSEAK